jgi:hypothetical protein
MLAGAGYSEVGDHFEVRVVSFPEIYDGPAPTAQSPVADGFYSCRFNAAASAAVGPVKRCGIGEHCLVLPNRGSTSKARLNSRDLVVPRCRRTTSVIPASTKLTRDVFGITARPLVARRWYQAAARPIRTPFRASAPPRWKCRPIPATARRTMRNERNNVTVAAGCAVGR